MGKVVAIIPARGGSKGIHRKNLLMLLGKPLVAWSIEHALMSDYIDEVYVSTEDDEIADVSCSFGAQVIRRSVELASDTASSESCLLHALHQIEHTVFVDLVVFLQATSPVRQLKLIDKAIDTLREQNADSLFSARSIEGFVWKQTENGLDSLTYDYHHRVRRQELLTTWVEENGSFFIFKPEILKKYNNRLGGKIIPYIVPGWQSHQIDEPKDIEICRTYMKNMLGVEDV